MAKLRLENSLGLPVEGSGWACISFQIAQKTARFVPRTEQKSSLLKKNYCKYDMLDLINK